MEGRNREIRLQIMLAEEEIQAIDDWRFKLRMPSRAAAIRELIRRGLAADGFELSEGRRSADYGIVDHANGNGKADY